MTTTELINQINNAKITQDTCWDECTLPEEIMQELKKYTVLAEELYIEKHRWYETSIIVYALNDEFIGIEYVTDIYSECTEYEDIEHKIYAIPMLASTVTTYTKKNN
jgi:hypothetical protein